MFLFCLLPRPSGDNKVTFVFFKLSYQLLPVDHSKREDWRQPVKMLYKDKAANSPGRKLAEWPGFTMHAEHQAGQYNNLKSFNITQLALGIETRSFNLKIFHHLCDYAIAPPTLCFTNTV